MSTEVDNMEYTKPFLKWVGGKTQIIHEVMEQFPSQMNDYHEPFLGGGSVLLAVLSRRCVQGRVYASDINANLISVYQNIQMHPEEVIQSLKELLHVFRQCKGTEVHRTPTLEESMTSPESYYYWIRTSFNALSLEERKTVSASAMFLFLNKTCFRGVYREGPHGFNVPFGNYKNPSVLDEAHLRHVSQLIQGVLFTCCSFEESLARVQPGDFVYLDPPYAPEQDTSFVAYTKGGFPLEKHQRLFQMCHDLKNVRWVMSNADVKLVKDAFPHHTMSVLSCRRAIHSKKPGSTTTEVIITNVPTPST